MNNEINKIYSNYVKNNFINYDTNQLSILNEIGKTWKDKKKINFFKKKIFYGIYLYGSVGIGKTFILNLFIQNEIKSKKIHFNHFMINLHAHINNNKGSLENYIKLFSQNKKIIFIDELHIFNIVDALLIKKIFLFFYKYKIFVLISSNFKPTNLYENGLQRDDFIPFINFIESNFKVIHMKNIKDYRRQALNQSKTYFTPINNDTSKEFNRLFEKFVDLSEIHIKKIQIKSRVVRFEKCTSNIVLCSFDQLCASNLGHDDYYNIAKVFNLFFINKVPYFTANISDQCRRFISLIDMLYDQSCSVVILADKPINQLCQINKMQKEFERTASRLYEMTIINNKINE